MNLRKLLVIVALVAASDLAHSDDNNRDLGLVCSDFSWGDVEALVEPYLSDELYVALVMQGQSSEYRISSAASQAMDDSLPEAVRGILKSLIASGC